jgi:D-alanyl-D-alanine carboxypeptidase (penicillin-binding protein 5/6)
LPRLALPFARRGLVPRWTTAAWLVLAAATILARPLPGRAQEVPELQITSKRYIVIDAETGEVFAQRGAHDQVAMASLTKVFTAIEALERGDLDQIITTKESDVFDPGSSTVMGFGPGESFTLRDLLYGMMLPSGNDAAHAIARALGYQNGDSDGQAVNRFVDAMNERVHDMGLTDTHLIRPDGWGVKGHYSSAHDLAVFTMYALKYPTFIDLISTVQYTTADGSYTVTNTNKMLNTYPGLIGGKTGYDDDAGYCLIEVARRDGTTMISVTLDGVAPDDWYDDNRVLLDYAFEQKAARVAANRPITGEIVSYRDPDAARVLAQATPGGSIGFLPPTATPTSVVAAPVIESSPAPDQDAAGVSPGEGGNRKLWIAVAVTMVVVAAGVAGSIFGGSSTNPGAGTD